MLLFSFTDWGWNKHKSQSKVPDKATSPISVSKQFNIKQIWQKRQWEIWNSSPRYITDAGNIQGRISDKTVLQFCLLFGCRFQQLSAELLQGCWSRRFRSYQARGKAEWVPEQKARIYFLPKAHLSLPAALFVQLFASSEALEAVSVPMGLEAY